MRLFLFSHNMGGMGISKDGDIVSVFKNSKIAKQYGIENIGGKLLMTAIHEGGCKLDCYDGFLPNWYIRYGFVPVCKVKFNDQYASDKWNYNRDGRPEVIFFKHNGESVEQIMKKSKNYKRFNEYDIPYCINYEAGKKERDRAMNRKTNKEYIDRWVN